MIVEFKPLFLKPFHISSKDLFTKRARDDKSTKTDSSKAPMMLSSIMSPLNKKVKMNLSATTFSSDSTMPLIVHSYAADAKPSTFAHFLGDMLLPQSMESHSAKPIESILDDTAGYSLHVTIFTLLFVFPFIIYS